MDRTTTGPNETGEAASRLRQQAATVKDDLAELGDAAKEVAQEKLETVKDSANRTVGDLREKTTDVIDEGKRKGAEVEERFLETVRNKPLQSIAVAAGIGIVIGMISRR